MISPPFTTTILRHRRENLKKCSLYGLEGHKNFHFLTYPVDPIPFLDCTILLSLDAPVLTTADKNYSLFLIDGTWKYAAIMEKQLPYREKWLHRSLPTGFKTAYPRKQTACIDPQRGLASVEALYIAYHILGWNTAKLLDHYYWKEEFLKINSQSLSHSTIYHQSV